MDEFEKRLKHDAAQIRADVSPQLADRIESSLHSAGRDAPIQKERDSTSTLWWASSLTGLAMAVAAIVLVNWNSQEVSSNNPVQEIADTVPNHRDYLKKIEEQLELQPGKVQFTSGLEEELSNLQADFEKARDNVAEDIDFTF